MFCQKCGKENTDGAAFCSSCGASVTGALPTDKSEPVLDLKSFLASSKKYQERKKKLETLPTMLLVVVFMIGIVGMIGGIFISNWELIFVSCMFWVVAIVVILPFFCVGLYRLEKYGNELYSKYLSKRK